jgi:CDP-glucose 4,6-dehydratase
VDPVGGADLRAWYRGKRVFLTGHTGFKGAWLAAWLADAGASVTGYALAPEGAGPNLFDAARVGDGIVSVIGDIRDRERLAAALREADPELVFHLAAQSLVRRSYAEPVETYDVNVMGTVRLLDALRPLRSLRAAVVVTSDKCYENRNLSRGYREDDPMGGHDPYSSSKGCAELVTSALRRSYFAAGRAAVASARAGNVIGGGDWAEDRLVPDLMRAAAAGASTPIRRPDAVRPWQFVLEPLRGYLVLGRALAEHGQAYADGWNFGPDDADAVSVREVVGRIRRSWNRVTAEFAEVPAGVHEAHFLTLDSRKARTQLDWRPALDLDETLGMTVEWYRAYYEDPSRAPALVREQLHDYERRVAGAGRSA